ncbi:MAG: radical SAM protein [Caldimicrobium sp.]|nr:radical SAM protein [Caldimicrobium sp.]MCX7873539.1 radical SAM protein [Caldimicrobium sp.]MDW8095105.1 radical SAM protein [Caldimicrobium sp.]
MKIVDFLLIHPWIYDFSSHDFWLRPYGLLSLAGKLRHHGYSLYYLDLLDPFHPHLPKPPKRKEFGTGHFYKETVPKPYFFLDVPRKFFRYGLPFPNFKREISQVQFKAVMVTCTLTYWYPGLFNLIDFFCRNYPGIPIYIGGIYSKLCLDHLLQYVRKYTQSPIKVVLEDIDSFIEHLKRHYSPSGVPHPYQYPAFDLQWAIPYVILQTSLGCPFNCPYCASKYLNKFFQQKNPLEVANEILYWHQNFKVIDFAFYDDALLVNFEQHLGPILEIILSRNLKLRFHTPNALHARYLNKEVALLLKKAGFVTLRLGFERLDNRLDKKLTTEEFIEAVENLKKAGFTGREIGAYVLFGLPDEDFEAVKRSLYFLADLKVSPYLAEFSPIPGTPLYEVAKETSRYPLDSDPLFHNKSVYPAFKKPPWPQIQEIKDLVRAIRKSISKV